jgi:multidrug efflux pump
MHENPEMSPREATFRSMQQIQVALVAIALVLSAVFLPMIFFGGSTGVIYRQFSATIVSAMALSVLVALILSPAIAANLLRRNHATVEQTAIGRRAPRFAHAVERARVKFNSGFERMTNWYVGTVAWAVDRKWLFLGLYAFICALLIVLYMRLPTGFIPTEDQGAAQVQFRLPAGATMTRTREVQETVEGYFLRGPEKDRVKTYFTVAGGGQGAAGQNSGQAFVNLADYDQRTGKEDSAEAIVERASGAFRGLRDAQVFALVPGAIRGLGQSSGFQDNFRTPAG